MRRVTKPLAGIVRVSHMGARKSGATDFHSETDQIAGLHIAAERHGTDLHILPSELDVSGGLELEQRPSLLKAVEGVERGDYSGIVFAYQSRIARNVEVEEEVWRRVEAAGGAIITAHDALDTSTADGRMVRRIRSAINTADRERHTERFDDLRRWATQAGIWQARQTPTGYQRDPETRGLVPDDRAGEVRRAFRDRAGGAAIVRLAEQLHMTSSGVRQLLQNRVYLGELKVGQYVNTAAHEPLVTVDEFEAAQISVPRPGRGATRTPALLSGLVRCEACGHVMSRGKTKVEVYSCHGRNSSGRCPAPAAVTLALLDDHVTEIALHELAGLTVKMADNNARLDDARAEVAAATRELTAYLDAVSAADVGAEAFAAGARQRRGRVDEAEATLRRLLALRPVVDILTEGLEAWEQMDDQRRNTVLRGLLEVVIVRRGGGRGSRTPLEDRVRVIAKGTSIALPRKNGGDPLGIVRLPFPDADGDGVLRVHRP